MRHCFTPPLTLDVHALRPGALLLAFPLVLHLVLLGGSTASLAQSSRPRSAPARLSPPRSTTPALAQTPRTPGSLPPGGGLAPSNAVLVDEEYLLGPGDRVKVDFFNVPELSGEFQVLPNGTVNLPQIGPVPVFGRTLSQASQSIGAKAASILRYPVVTVSLLAARPITIAIAGEVNRPGTYTLPGVATEGNVPSLTRALRLAEGVTQSANLGQVEIRRPRSPKSTAGQLVTVDLAQLLRSGDLGQDLRLRDGDSIFVPTRTQINFEESWQLADANFATLPDRPLRISVVGRVNRPGPYTVSGERVAAVGEAGGGSARVQVPTVSRAIQVAGGILPQDADIRNITVTRVPRSGEPQKIKIDFWKLLKTGDIRQDLPLQDGDTIEVPLATALAANEAKDLGLASFSPTSITVNVVGEVEKPGALQMAPNTPVLQALLAAGGFNSRAKRGAVTLLRLNTDGTVSKQDISVDYGKGINASNNPVLQNGDTIVAARSGISSFNEGLGTVLNPFGSILNLIRIFVPF